MGSLDVLSFQSQILDWYRANARRLPWRGDHDPYHVLVSEVMLQQTQVDRVKPKYCAFLLQFPTLLSLACAPTSEVLRAWQGLGYNRRALNLKRAAEIVVRDQAGELPQSVEELERLPGIGRYTARAIASLAFGQHVAVVDTNVRRVLSSYAGKDLNLREAEVLAEQLLPQGGAAEWNQALMDFGASHRRARKRSRGGAAKPFATTNRFWRGRIVDALRREDCLSIPALLEGLPRTGRDDSRVRGLVLALHEEGLVDYDSSEDKVSLPL